MVPSWAWFQVRSLISPEKQVPTQVHLSALISLQAEAPHTVLRRPRLLLFNKEGGWCVEGLENRKGREVGRGERRKARSWSFLLSTWILHFTLPMHSEMLIKGHFPEELSARSGPACSGRLSWLICKEAITPPQGNGSVFRLKSSLQYCARSSLRRQCCSHPGRGAGLLGNQPPRLWVKLRCRVS